MPLFEILVKAFINESTLKQEPQPDALPARLVYTRLWL
jgi:hypothetical protein